MSLFSPSTTASGPTNAKIAIVGEAPGKDEALTGLPFMGHSGQELTRMLLEAGIERGLCYLTNVLWTRPPDNKLDKFLLPKREVPKDYPLPAVKQGGYLHPDLLPEIDRLRDELSAVRPNLVVAVGGTACWALLGSSKITSLRGTVAESTLVPGLKVLPTFHPAAVLRNWEYRPVVVADLLKARREMEFPEIRRPRRSILINPGVHDVINWCDKAMASSILGSDVETSHRQITVMGFATSPEEAIAIPIWDKSKPDWSYWSQVDELCIWSHIANLLSRHPRVVFQNGLYDAQYIWRMGIPVPGFVDDTMLLHHALFPELPKGLGFLGSIYTNETSWKNLRPRGGEEKRDA